MMLDVRAQFPIFAMRPELVYLDSAATAQKPTYVLDAVQHFLTNSYANIHRGHYPLALEAEQLRREARQVVAQVLSCATEQIVFTAGATHSVNLLTTSLLRSKRLEPGDIILLSIAEHHANIVPWQILAEQTGAQIVYLKLTPDRQYDRSSLAGINHQRIKIVSLTLVSNVTGQVMDLSGVKQLPHQEFIYVVDGAQAMPHFAVDVQQLDCDFFYFTGHKVGALTGSGVLYGRKAWLDRLLPGIGGGGAIQEVGSSTHTYQPAPDKFEPGTPNVVAAISLRAAFAWIATLGTGKTFIDQLHSGYAVLQDHERKLTKQVLHHLPEIEKLVISLVGSTHEENRIALFSFALPAHISAAQLTTKLGVDGICVRTGTHCTHIFHDALACGPTLRISAWAYTTIEDIEKFFSSFQKHITT